AVARSAPGKPNRHTHDLNRNPHHYINPQRQPPHSGQGLAIAQFLHERHNFLPVIDWKGIGPKYRLSWASNRLSPMTKNWSGGRVMELSGGRERGDKSNATS